jgi:hypothetical protein
MPLKEGQVLRCYLTRQKSIFSSLSETIQLFKTNSQNLLLHACKYRGKSGASYFFGIERNLIEQNSFAKMQIFKAQNQFQLFLKDQENPSITIHYSSENSKSLQKKFHVLFSPFDFRSCFLNIQKKSKHNNKSIKNFLLICGRRKSLEFVKESKTKYQLFIRYSFSVIEALALACASMSNFEK